MLSFFFRDSLSAHSTFSCLIPISYLFSSKIFFNLRRKRYWMWIKHQKYWVILWNQLISCNFFKNFSASCEGHASRSNLEQVHIDPDATDEHCARNAWGVVLESASELLGWRCGGSTEHSSALSRSRCRLLRCAHSHGTSNYIFSILQPSFTLSIHGFCCIL